MSATHDLATTTQEAGAAAADAHKKAEVSNQEPASEPTEPIFTPGNVASSTGSGAESAEKSVPGLAAENVEGKTDPAMMREAAGEQTVTATNQKADWLHQMRTYRAELDEELSGVSSLSDLASYTTERVKHCLRMSRRMFAVAEKGCENCAMICVELNAFADRFYKMLDGQHITTSTEDPLAKDAKETAKIIEKVA
ncbi:unnamed protein product [Gongylonema pulchrum]|uniref:SCAPER_N domain-containing protein n=1 Tax=Gongylonema pulchrum TaxID=637853 RepID=A0A183D8E6_9BILA|nr:unnamed protein product [Gongylonema pulchrum]